MKTWSNGGAVAHILNLSTRRRWAISFTPQPLYPQWRNLCYLLLIWRQWQGGKFPAPARNWNLVIQPVA